MKITLKNLVGHYSTITRHRHRVIAHCKKAGILYQGLFHDLSKYLPAEFLAGVRYYANGTKSPNEKEREIFGYSPAWLHHKGRNKHHFEYWCDYSPETKKMSPVKMPARYLKELICDRVAASKIYQGENYRDKHPLEYFMKGMQNRFIHQETSDKIQELLTVLSEQGEEELFKRLRTMKNY